MILFLVRRYDERNGPATRNEILNAVRHEPGLTKSQLCRRLGLAWGTISHHLRILEKERQLVRHKVVGWTRIYTADNGGPELALMTLLRQDTVTRILGSVRQHPGIGIQGLCRELSMGRKVMRRHLQGMVESGLVSRTDDYRPKFYPGDEPVGLPTRPEPENHDNFGMHQ